jgi:hypothetical protein
MSCPTTSAVRVADARQIGRDHHKALGQLRHDRSPHQRRLRITVQQKQRRAVPGGQIMQLHAMDQRRARGDLRGLAGTSLRREFDGEHERDDTEKYESTFHGLGLLE